MLGAAQNVTVAIQNNAGPGGVLSGSTTVAVNTATGNATFSGLAIDKIGIGYTLTATGSTVNTSPGVVLSSAFNITVGSAAKLVFGQQPTGAGAGMTISPAVTVLVQDANGNTVAGDNSNVTLAITTNPGGGMLSGTTTVAAVNGVATFSNLSINKAGTGYVLTATDGALTSVASNSFNITFGSPAKLAFAQQPSTTASGAQHYPGGDSAGPGCQWEHGDDRQFQCDNGLAAIRAAGR